MASMEAEAESEVEAEREDRLEVPSYAFRNVELRAPPESQSLCTEQLCS